MKVLITADWHVCPQNHENTIPAMRFVADVVEKEKIDVVVHAGDLFQFRGRLDPTSIFHVRECFARIRARARVVFVPGNHDAANAFGDVDSATAIFGSVDDRKDGVIVAQRPGWITIPALDDGDTTSEELHIACVPCPSKYHLQARGPEAESVVDMLGRVYRGLAAEMAGAIDAEDPSMLVFHGGVSGAQLENEQTIGVGQDVTIPREFLDGPWQVMVAGHLHKPQEVAGVHYPGSLVPLTHAQADMDPRVIICEWGDDNFPRLTTISVPVARPFVTVDVDMPVDCTLTECARLNLSAYTLELLQRAYVRVKVSATAERIRAEWNEQEIRAAFPGVRDWKFQIEREASVRIRSEATVETPIAQLVDEWLALQSPAAATGLIPEFSGDLKALAVRMNAEVDREGKLPRLADYNPVSTRIMNFKQFTSSVILWQHLPAVTCIRGPNAAGKSNLIRSEAFALFGLKALGGSPLRRVVRDGQASCEVEHLFEVGARRYIIRRTVKISSSGKATSDVSFARANEGTDQLDDFQSLNAADARATQTLIEQLVGSYELFVATRYARQNEISRLLRMTPAERKDLLLAAIQAGRFAAIDERARAFANQLEREVIPARARALHLKSAAAQLEATDQALEENRIATELTEAAIAMNEKRAGAYADALVKLNADLATTREQWRKFRSFDSMIGTIDTNVAGIQKRKKELEDVAAQSERIAEALEDVAGLRDDVDQHRERLQRATELDGSFRAIEEKIAGVQRRRERELDTKNDTIAHKKRQAELLEGVPCQAIGLVGISRDLKIETINVAEATRGCQFLKDAVEARGAIAKLEEDLKAYVADNSELELLEQRRKGISLKRAEVGYDKAAHDRDVAALKAIDEPELMRKSQEIAGAAAYVDSATHRLEELAHERAGLIEQKEQLGTLIQEAEILKEIAEYKAAIASCDETIPEQRGRLTRLAREKGQLEAQLEAKNKATAEIADAEAQLAQLERSHAIASTLALAMSRNGIPYLMLERAVPHLQTTMNDLLEHTGITIEISSIRDKESGGVAEEVVVHFVDANGRQVLEDASGYQANLIGLAMQAAVTELQADRAGVRPPFFVIDEGFGAYDAENLNHGRELIHKLAARFGRVLYVTHVPEIQEAAAASIVVTPAADGSKAEII